MKKKYMHLVEFMGSCFHQDWRQEYGTAEEACTQFFKDSDIQSLKEIQNELVNFISDNPKPNNYDLQRIACYIDPDYLKMSHVEFLEWIYDEMNNAIK